MTKMDDRKENVVNFQLPLIEYKVLETVKWFGTAQSCITYGMTACVGKETVLKIDELSVDFEKVKRFVSLCNEHHASLAHVEDLVHDFFYYG